MDFSSAVQASISTTVTGGFCTDQKKLEEKLCR
jgi:hypothetical protein